jgi:ribosomal protein S12 methylthiotransferase
VGKVHLISLGCPKNLVDSEKLLKRLHGHGISYSSELEDCDIIAVNTCGFIEEAKRESVEEILNVAGRKGKKKLVVFGCLAKRYGRELANEIPEIDALWGVGEEDEIVEYCKNAVSGNGARVPEKFTDRPYAYLKIAEGCDRSCSYCVIPSIRGPYKSRKPEDILRDAEDHVNAGIKELILVAQDIVSYGKEMRGYDLPRLIRDISSITGDFRIRLLYLYPAAINERFLECVGTEEKVCKYFDMPLQHSEEKILKLMGRGGNSGYFERLISQIRDVVPGAIIRTTFIVGFPHETEKDFGETVEFIRSVRFDRLGVFTYSKEKGTAAFQLKRHVPERIKKERYRRIMEIQSGISLEKNKALVGSTFRALVDEVGDDVAVARLYSQAPEIDGVVFVHDKKIKKGDFVNVQIVEAYDYDLKGVVRR